MTLNYLKSIYKHKYIAHRKSLIDGKKAVVIQNILKSN